MVFTVYCLYCNVSGLVVLLLNKFDLIWFEIATFSQKTSKHSLGGEYSWPDQTHIQYGGDILPHTAPLMSSSVPPPRSIILTTSSEIKKGYSTIRFPRSRSRSAGFHCKVHKLLVRMRGNWLLNSAHFVYFLYCPQFLTDSRRLWNRYSLLIWNIKFTISFSVHVKLSLFLSPLPLPLSYRIVSFVRETTSVDNVHASNRIFYYVLRIWRKGRQFSPNFHCIWCRNFTPVLVEVDFSDARMILDPLLLGCLWHWLLMCGQNALFPFNYVFKL